MTVQSANRPARSIVHVVRSLEVGGLENGVVNVVSALDGEVDQVVVCMTRAGALASRLPAAARVVELGVATRDRLAMLRLARLFRRLRPGIVHSRNWPTIEAIPAARMARVPVVIHGEHGREAADPEGRDARRNRVRRLLAPLVDRFVAVSADLEGWLARDVRIPARKLVTVRNGVDTTRFSDDMREVGRRTLGVAADASVVGTVGRLDPVKDHASLLCAFARLGGRYPDALLVVVGDGPCRAELEAIARQAGMSARVRFLGERSDVPALLAGMDVFVLPSIAEGISNTILEALASGLPVVATRVGGNPELVVDGVTGSLVPPRDAAALAAAVAEYLDDGPLRRAHGKAARARAVECFSLDRMVNGYRRLYAELAGEKGTR